MSSSIALLRELPQVEKILQTPTLAALATLLPHDILADCARKAIDEARQDILTGAAQAVDPEAIANAACECALAYFRPSLKRVINATGVIIHTNLGRSPLAEEAIDAVVDVARGASTLEYSTADMARGSRHVHVEQLICSLTGAEAALVVNNNAAAVMMVLNEFARGHEAIVSRGELIEIGGSFRIPDIMELSHATMVEVGTTNKTHASDYQQAITPRTAMLLKVHPSNYRMVGFVDSVSLNEMRSLADAENEQRRLRAAEQDDDRTTDRTECGSQQGVAPLLVYEDQGSGSLLHLDCFGTYAEPTVSESLARGADLVSFSGDKLLGGPQAGIIAGRADLIARLKKNPMARTVRLDKMTLAALEATLRLYLKPEEALQKIPTLRMLTEDPSIVEARAQQLAQAISARCAKDTVAATVAPEIARAGGGALPMCDIDSFCVRLEFAQASAQEAETFLIQKRAVPVIGVIKKDAVQFDARTIRTDEIPEIAEAVAAFCATL